MSLYQGLQTALAPFAPRAHDIDQGAVWLRDIADILGPPGDRALSSTQVAGWLRGYLGSLVRQDCESTLLADFVLHVNKVSHSYWAGLFHCYEVEGLARTNKDLESHFRDVQHRLLRTTGQKGGTRRVLHRLGAWELLKSPLSESECLDALRQIPDEDLADERQRVDQHRQRFRFEVRSVKRADAQLDRLLQQWLAIPKHSTG